MNLALKEGGYLTWITILNNNEIVKRGRGSRRKRFLQNAKIIMENNPTTPNVYILCFIWVQFSFCALQNDKWYDRIYCFIHYFFWEGGYLTWITILNNNEIVKRGRGLEEKDTCKKLKIIMENNSITLNVYIWCFIWVQFSLCALKSDKFYDII